MNKEVYIEHQNSKCFRTETTFRFLGFRTYEGELVTVLNYVAEATGPIMLKFSTLGVLNCTWYGFV